MQNAPKQSFKIDIVWFSACCQLPSVQAAHMHVNCNSTQGHTASPIAEGNLRNRNRFELRGDIQVATVVATVTYITDEHMLT